MSVRLVYEDIAVGAEEDASVSTTAAQSFSEPSQLPHGAESVPIAALELNGWVLDGTRQLLNGQKVGFWSSALSGEDGTFSIPPVLTVAFDQQYTSLGIALEFDTFTGAYCSQVTVRWYQGTALLAKKVFYPDSASYFCENTVEHYNKVEIQLDATHLPLSYAKLSHIRFGVSRTFGRDELRSVKITQQIDLISAELAVNKMHFTLDSKSGISYIFQQLQPIYAYNGETLVDVFYIEEASRKGEELYDISSSDAVGVLDKETIPGAIYSAKPVRALVEAILDGKFALELDPTLEGETVTGYIPDGTRRNALRHIAFALRAVVDTSGTDAVRLYRPVTSGAAEVPPSRTYVGGSVSTKAVVTAVKVTAHSFSTSGSGESVTVGGVTYYDTKTVTTINNPNVTASDKQNVVEITDATLVNPSNVAAVAQHVYDYHMRRSTHNVKIVVDQEKPGDYVTTHTPWGAEITGNITMMDLTLSGITAAECEVVGA